MFLAAAAAAQTQSPVLVELFTSEGCSDCPPADLVLAHLDSKVIVLSEHVDYWNHLGWKDPFSAPQYSRRQEAYCTMLASQGPYTPQMVVDGETEFVGSDAARAAAAIAKAAKRPKTEIKLTRGPAGLQIDIASAPAAGDVWLALADDRDASQVAAGENKGRRLEHVAVVRSLRKIGTVKHGRAFSHLEELPAANAPQRVVVFVQDAGPGRVTGVAMWRGGASTAGSQ